VKRALALLLPLSLVVAACGGDDSSADPPVTTQAAPETTSEATVATTAPGDDTGDDTGDDGTGTTDGGTDDGADRDGATPPPSGDPSSPYCQVARQFQESEDELDEAFDPFDFSPERFREAFELAAEGFDDLRRTAPPEIRADVETVIDGFLLLRDELEAADYNFFAMDIEAFATVGEQLDEASRRIEDYNEAVCGIPRSGDFDDFDDFDFDDFDLDDLDLGDLDLDDFDLDDLGDFGAMVRAELEAEFIREGYSRAEAECLAEAIFDLDFTSSDPQAVVDPFERCGVSP
jgi:hypothetical protein